MLNKTTVHIVVALDGAFAFESANDEAWELSREAWSNIEKAFEPNATFVCDARRFFFASNLQGPNDHLYFAGYSEDFFPFEMREGLFQKDHIYVVGGNDLLRKYIDIADKAIFIRTGEIYNPAPEEEIIDSDIFLKLKNNFHSSRDNFFYRDGEIQIVAADSFSGINDEETMIFDDPTKLNEPEFIDDEEERADSLLLVIPFDNRLGFLVCGPEEQRSSATRIMAKSVNRYKRDTGSPQVSIWLEGDKHLKFRFANEEQATECIKQLDRFFYNI